MGKVRPFGHYLWVNFTIQWSWHIGITYVVFLVAAFVPANGFEDAMQWGLGALAVSVFIVRPIIAAMQHQKYDEVQARYERLEKAAVQDLEFEFELINEEVERP